MGWRWGEGRRPEIRPFYLDRQEDVSGVSGKGVVAVGVVLPSGKCVLEWRSRMRTVTVFESVDQVARIHGHGGRTRLCWGLPPENTVRAGSAPGLRWFLTPLVVKIARSWVLARWGMRKAWADAGRFTRRLATGQILPRLPGKGGHLPLPRRLSRPGEEPER